MLICTLLCATKIKKIVQCISKARTIYNKKCNRTSELPLQIEDFTTYLDNSPQYLQLVGELEECLTTFKNIDTGKLQIPEEMPTQKLLLDLFSATPCNVNYSLQAIDNLLLNPYYQRKCITICCNIFPQSQTNEHIMYLIKKISNNHGLLKYAISHFLNTTDLESILEALDGELELCEIGDIVTHKIAQLNSTYECMQKKEVLLEHHYDSIQSLLEDQFKKRIVIKKSMICAKCGKPILLCCKLLSDQLYHIEC